MGAPLYAYQPSKWGTEFARLTQDEALGAGAAGPGKTTVLLHEADQQIIIEQERQTNPDHPHRLGKGQSTGWALFLRRTMPMLRQTIARSARIFPLLDPRAEFKAQDHTWVFSSGYRFQFGHCNDVDDWQSYMSDEYSILLFDELVQFTEEQYDQISTRVRSSDPVLRRMLKIRSMSNPVMRRGVDENFAVYDPNWVRKRFVDPARDGRVTLKRPIEMDDGSIEYRTWIYLPARLKENPDPKFARDYEKTLRNAPPHVRLALLEGDWYVTVDSYFASVWNPRVHICTPFKIPPDWPKFRSMDWGYKSPGCVHWYAVSPEDQLFVFKELTFRDKTADVVAEMVKEIEKEMGIWRDGRKRSPLTGPADTQLWEARGERGKSKAQEFLERGVGWTKADKKSRQRNAERLSRLLDTDRGLRDPGIVLFANCANAIRTLPAIQTNPNCIDEPADGGEDHWVDSLFYGTAHFSRGRSYIATMRDDDDDDEREAETRMERSRFGYGSVA